MSAILAFHSGAWFEVDEDYDALRELQRQHFEKSELYEITLTEGRYGAIPHTVRLTVAPWSVAYVQEKT